MKITRAALLIVLLACQKAPEAEEAEPDSMHESLGPGSEPSVLIPPDTPMTSRDRPGSIRRGGTPGDTIR